MIQKLNHRYKFEPEKYVIKKGSPGERRSRFQKQSFTEADVLQNTCS